MNLKSINMFKYRNDLESIKKAKKHMPIYHYWSTYHVSKILKITK